MTFVVTEKCIRCKYMDCVEVCPVDCFHEGPNMLVIDPDECIDCTLCEPECPAEAIYSEDEVPKGQEQMLALNTELSQLWPVITEAHHMLDFDRRAQVALLEWLNRGAVRIYEIHAHEIQDLIELTEKYNDLPMDLADATLVQAANQLHLQQIITIDSDFNVYRTAKNRMLQNIFKEGRRGKA